MDRTLQEEEAREESEAARWFEGYRAGRAIGHMQAVVALYEHYAAAQEALPPLLAAWAEAMMPHPPSLPAMGDDEEDGAGGTD